MQLDQRRLLVELLLLLLLIFATRFLKKAATADIFGGFGAT